MREDRIQRLAERLAQHDLHALALAPGASLFYLTGLSFHLMERPVVGIFTADGHAGLVLPELERSRAESSGLPLHVIPYGEEETSRMQAFVEAAKEFDLDGHAIGILPLELRAFELSLLERVAPEATFAAAEGLLGGLRVVKDAEEIASLRRAVQLAEAAMRSTLPLVKIGMTEEELAGELVVQLLRAGSETTLPFKPIVASGPNSALPHALPTDRALEPGDLLIIDWGGTVGGYGSDLTRTYAVDRLEEELARIHQIVQQANAAGRGAVRVGGSCAEVDRAAREVIESAGYGAFFVHRTGHGIGLEAHEPPYLRADNEELLQPGMAFTVEPGIYLPQRGGVRVEDNLIVTERGSECLSTLPRELTFIG